MIDQIVRLFAPFHCLSCGQEKDKLLCDSCRDELVKVPSRCYICRATTRSYIVCSSCRTKTPLRSVAVYAHYEGLAKEIVHAAKYERAKAGLVEIAQMMSTLLPYFGDDIILTHVPTASSRVRERGYDQAEIIAKWLGRHQRAPYARLLARLGQAHQVGSKRSERISHVRHAFRAIHEAKVKGAHIVLVDDVCTTGASLESAARMLKRAGARRVDAIVFSQPN